jgi:hypothetical protein
MFDERDAARRTELHGETMTRFVLTPFDPAGTLMPVADVMISATLISSVPLAANNRELLYSNPGTPITLARSASGRLEVTGLSKRGYGNVFTYNVTVPEITPMASDGGSNLASLVLTSVAVSGFTVSVATLGELATATTGGFGETPLEALLIKNPDGTIFSVP